MTPRQGLLCDPYGRRALRTTAKRRIATGGKMIATEPRKRRPGQQQTSGPGFKISAQRTLLDYFQHHVRQHQD
jgi:hypothetical protein